MYKLNALLAKTGTALIYATYLSLQYRRALLGTVICFSHVALQHGISPDPGHKEILIPCREEMTRVNTGDSDIPEIQKAGSHVQLAVVRLARSPRVTRSQFGDGQVDVGCASSVHCWPVRLGPEDMRRGRRAAVMERRRGGWLSHGWR